MDPHTPTQPEATVGNIPPATKPGQVETWLATLPLANPAHAAARLSAYLAAHRHSTLGTALRQSLLEQATPLASRIVDDLATSCASASQPLAPAYRRQIDRAVDLLLELAAGYKLLSEQAANQDAAEAEGACLPILLLRLLGLLRETTEICHANHIPSPAGVWLDLHRLHQYASDTGALGTTDPRMGDPANLETLYKSTLLAAIADPFHMSRQEWLWTLEIINRHGHLASLLRADHPGQGGTFAIFVGSDTPPRPLAWQRRSRDACQFILNTTTLVRTLALLCNRLQRGDSGDVPSLAAARQNSSYLRHLDRLRQRWGASLQRQSTRRQPSEERSRAVLFGLTHVCRWLCAGDGAVTDGAETPAGDASELCRVVDEGIGGIALRRGAAPDFALSIGTLVGIMHAARPAHCDVGLVRWFKSGTGGEVVFGVKFLAGQPACLELQQGRHGTPGLLLRGTGRGPQGETLILSATAAEPPDVVEVRLGGDKKMLRLQPHEEQATDVRIYRCRPVG